MKLSFFPFLLLSIFAQPAFAEELREIVLKHSFTAPRGSEVAPVDLIGKATLIYIWASWCPVCAGELKRLNNLYRYLHPQGLQVIAIAVESDPDPAAAEKLSFPTLYDKKGLLAQLASERGLPTAFLLRGDTPVTLPGKQDWLISGPVEWDRPELADQIRELLTSKQ